MAVSAQRRLFLAMCGFLVALLILVGTKHHVAGEIMFIAERLPLKGDRSQSDVPWPMPEMWSRDNNVTFTLRPSALRFVHDACDVIDDAVGRYRHLLGLLREGEGEGGISTVEMTINSGMCEKLPYLGMDESYTVTTTSSKVTIQANTTWGALRGLETFSQLPFEDAGEVKIKKWTIADKPRFAHRGFMIDTSRHYLPLPIIKKHLDAMAWSKLNVLHWHIVDAQSFPFVSRTFPQLSEKGAFTARHLYSPEAVAEVIEHARLRGIRVLPEFDTPGHGHSWGKAMPELLTPCFYHGQPFTAQYGQHAESENFDPTKETTFTFLSQFMQEVKDVFKDKFLHVGMDEAHYMCWKSSPNISAFMAQHGFKGDYPKLEQYYVTRALDVISNVTGRDLIMWQDPLDSGVKVVNTTIVEVWKNARNMRECNQTFPDEWEEYASLVAKSGNRMLISSCWYLNYICYGEDWRRFYACDPHNFTSDPEEQQLVVGGEACMWAEFVDGTNFLQRAWPRAAATAERLWSPRHVTDPDTAAFRLDSHRCRLLRRGVPAQPVLPGYCGDYEFGFEPETPGGGAGVTQLPCQTGGASKNRGCPFFMYLAAVLSVALALLKPM